MVFEGGDFGWSLDHEGGVLMSRISALNEEGRELTSSLSVM